MSGKTYGGRYAVEERVGVGGMAEVYRARDELLGREVAVKVLHQRFSHDSSFVERFRREAQAAANLSHPNIVSLYDYGTDEAGSYIVMEFIDGKGLDEVIRAEGPLLPQRAAEIAMDVARALERAHEQGLVHRDIKPNNIMITSYGQTKVTDFGIVRALGADAEQTMTQTGMVIGTAAYLSPEQAQGLPVDARSDVYSLGCVLYEMLTGRAPFTGDTPLSIAYKHVRESPTVPSQVNPDVPEALDAVVMKALAKNPENRYDSAAELRADLERFNAGQTVAATPVLAGATAVAPAATGTQVLRREDVYYSDEEPEPDRRNPALYVVMALLILGLFALIAWAVANNLFGEEKLVRVPDVEGLERADAQDRLENRGFEVDVESKANRADPGTVFDQDPDPQAQVEEGSVVTIFVSRGARQTEVPDVVGMTREEAEDALADANLEVGTTTAEPTDEAEPGTVLEQDPPAGEEVDAGSEVDLVIAAEEALVSVPDVLNQSQSSAEAELQQAGLGVDVITAPSESEAGLVIAQDPGPGEEIAPGDVVTITVSEGPEEQPMPDVRGQDYDDAEAQLQELGLQVERVDEACTDAVPPGTVCDQDPAPGTPVAEGDTATLYVQVGEGSFGSVGALLLLLGSLVIRTRR